MEIQLRCDQEESVMYESINARLNLCSGKLVTVMMGVGHASFAGAHVSFAALMDSVVNILIHTHTWPSTNTAVKDLSNLCAREPHTPPEALMELVKTMGCALAASLILSPNYC